MNRLDGRVGVVNRRGKRAQRDVDELPHAEPDVLLQRPLVADHDGVLDGARQCGRVGRRLLEGGTPRVRDRAPGHDVLAHQGSDQHGHLELLGQREQPFGMDGLHVTMPAGGDRHCPYRRRRRRARP